MKKSVKRFVSILLTIVIIFGGTGRVFASVNNSASLDSKNLKFIELSDEKLVYTYEENGRIYKNIDFISKDNMKVETIKYEIIDNKDVFVDKIYYEIDQSNQSIKTHSVRNNSYYETKIKVQYNDSTYGDQYNWRYKTSYTGNTKFQTYSIGAIAAALATTLTGITGMPWIARFLIVVAASIFDKSLTVVYFKVNEYVDDSNRLRPKYKDIVKIYEDKHYNYYIDTETRIFDAVM
ncbi:hypothetical protein [uncultured Peptoniphilus sp.]|uniref:hypothetical protein n=1 Tax=uncultured Peptoniphilus sp. TaxID=254354 RepID=UPI00260083D5|nr:hypothetical protein [uncultured Peptoniphilus sp.]